MDTKKISKSTLNYLSWFDMWHTHVDWDSEGNKSWKIRKEFLKELLSTYSYVNKKMSAKKRIYQSWISIDLDDAGQDAVYLHTKNPNTNNYPLKMKQSRRSFAHSPLLIKFIEESNLEWFKVANYRYLVVYNPHWGEKLF